MRSNRVYSPNQSAKVHRQSSWSRKNEKSNRPFEHHRSNAQPVKAVKKITLIFALTILFFGAWAILFSGWFKVKEIQVADNLNVPSEKAVSLVRNYLNGRFLLVVPLDNWLAVSKNDIKDLLFSRYQLRNVSVNRRVGKLIIKLDEKTYNYIWQEGESYYYINDLGEIILTKLSPLPDYPVIVNATSTIRLDEKINVDQKVLSFAGELDSLLKNDNHGLSSRTFVFDNLANTLKIKLTQGPYLLFNIRLSPLDQLKKLDAIRRQELSDGAKFNSLEYLDLRFGDRIFYK